MQLSFEYYCPTCKVKKNVEGSPGYYCEQGFVECECGTKIEVTQKDLPIEDE